MNTSTVYAIEDGNTTDKAEKEKRHSLLFGVLKKTTDSLDIIVNETLKSTEKTVKDSLDYTNKTVKVIISPNETKPVTTTVENTGKLVGKTVENTIPVVESVTDTVTETVSTTTKELNTTIDKLPTIPVITPVVNEVRDIVDKTTSSVVDVVDGTVDSVTSKVPPLPIVEPVVEEVKNTIKKTTATINPVEKKEEEMPVKPVVIPKPNHQQSEKIDSEGIQLVKEPTRLEDSAVNNTPETVLPEQETPSDVPLTPVMEKKPLKQSVTTLEVSEDKKEQLHEKVKTGESFSQVDNGTVKKEYQTPSIIPQAKTTLTQSQPYSSLPLDTEKDWRSETWAVITTGSSSTTSPTFAIGSNGDMSIGVLFNVFLLSTSTGKQWVHPDDTVMMQWTHAPPGRPPQATPFLYVNPTY